MQIQYTKNVTLEKLELGTTLSYPNWSIFNWMVVKLEWPPCGILVYHSGNFFVRRRMDGISYSIFPQIPNKHALRFFLDQSDFKFV